MIELKTNIAKVQCDRCGYQSELKLSKNNEDKILTLFVEEVTDLKHFAVQNGRWVSLH